MACLKRLRIPVISMDEAVAVLAQRKRLKRHSVVLTFDDGYENFLHYALPVLEKYRFPSTVYVVADRIGRTADWLGAVGLPEAPLMGHEDLRRIRASGVTLGSHGLRHLALARQEDSVLAEELNLSKDKLEQGFGIRFEHFCYPYGSCDDRVFHFTRQAGYTSGVTCKRARARWGDDLLALPRKAISLGDSWAGFLWKILRP